ncbi:unnamed protein product, partial [Ectocarpus sp. 12 AP-2014]
RPAAPLLRPPWRRKAHAAASKFMSMDSRSRVVSGGGMRGVGCPPGPQDGVNRRQSPHGQQPHRLSGKSSKPDPWLAGTAPECT